MEHETILIVDDNYDAVEILKQILASMNYETITAFHGKSGLQIAAERHPDLIFLDMNMPVMDGLEMLTALRRTDCASPVIFMTAYGSEQIAIDAFRLGVRDYLNKPFTKDEVKLAIDRALRETRLVRERETLNRSLLTAEAVRVTVVTLSHYLNNYLTALNGGLQLLEETLQQDWPNPELLQLLEDSRKSCANIAAVMRVLLRTTSVKLTPYTNTTPMLDIEAVLNKELDQVAQYRR